MKKGGNFPKYLYHATSLSNLIAILEEKVFTPKGRRISGYDEDTISFSDILSDYLSFYGDVIIELSARRLMEKNKIYPYRYDVEENSQDFYDMPFWEAEWRGKNVKFEYSDVNKIYFLDLPLLSITKFLHENKIEFEIISKEDLPSYSEEYYIEKYKK